MNFKTFLMFLTPIFAIGSIAIASPNDSRVYGYDAIVNELSRSQTRIPSYKGADPFDMVEIHAGVGFANSLFSLATQGNDDSQFAVSGLQVSLGIDLFSKYWMAEGTIRNFGKTKRSNLESTLREFDLKLVYRSPINTFLKFKTGLGLSGRFLKLSEVTTDGVLETEYTTPSSLIFVGLSSHITNGISVGAEASGRLSMISDTIDKNSVDLTLRLDTHF